MSTSSADDSLRQALRPPGPVQFDLQEELRAGIRAISVAGELDMLTAPKLAARLNDLLRQDEADLVLDLTETVFIDSAGLHTLLNAQRRLIQRGRALGVICALGPVREVIELARLGDTLGVVSTWEQLPVRDAA